MTDLPTAKTRPASNWSAIWVLPLIALIIGGWLGWRAYNETGIEIQVRFESGEGIQANKTEVVYKGMSVGKVKTLKLDDEGNSKGVIATVEMNKDVEPYLRTSTRFWLIKPSVTLAGITGLETLVSGNYVAISPGEGEPTRKFKALAEEPPLSDAQPGLHLTIKADRLGSLNRGSPVFYKQIKVGQIKSYLLSEDQSTVELKVFIEPTYAKLVRKHTRFWNASGISIDANRVGCESAQRVAGEHCRRRYRVRHAGEPQGQPAHRPESAVSSLRRFRCSRRRYSGQGQTQRLRRNAGWSHTGYVQRHPGRQSESAQDRS